MTFEPAFDAATEMSVLHYYDQHPEAGSAFSQAMSDLGATITQAIVASYDFSQFKTIMDVDGAQGGLLTAILQAHLKYSNSGSFQAILSPRQARRLY